MDSITVLPNCVCSFCGQSLYRFPRDLRRNKRAFCNRRCKDAWQKVNLSGCANPHYGKHHSVMQRKQIGLATIEHFKNPEIRHKHRQGLLRSGAKEHASKWMRQHRYEEWFIKKTIQGLRIKPNKVERKLMHILNCYFPKEWEYNTGKVVLNGLIPDFTNINGRKAVIEVFGSYWHSENKKHYRKLSWHQTELGRMMAYNALGFKCLVIWDYNLANEKAIVSKVNQFTEGG